MRFLWIPFILFSAVLRAQSSSPEMLVELGKEQLAGSMAGDSIRVPIALDHFVRAAHIFSTLGKADDVRGLNSGIYWCAKNCDEAALKCLRMKLGENSPLVKRIDQSSAIGDAAEEQRLFNDAVELEAKTPDDPLAAAMYYEVLRRFGSEIYKEESKTRYETLRRRASDAHRNRWENCRPTFGVWIKQDGMRLRMADNGTFRTSVSDFGNGTWIQNGNSITITFSGRQPTDFIYLNDNTLREGKFIWQRTPCLPCILETYKPGLKDDSVQKTFEGLQRSAAELIESYRKALNSALERVSRTGNLKGAVSIKGELRVLAERPALWRSVAILPEGEAQLAQKKFNYDMQIERRNYASVLKQKISVNIRQGKVDDSLAWREEYRRFLAAPMDAIEYGGQFYSVLPMSVNWQEAKEHCENSGGVLATIDSRELESDLMKSFGTVQKGIWWIGLYNVPTGTGARSNVWRWLSNQPVKYRNFGPGEPNNANNAEDVVVMESSEGKNCTWNDLHKDANHWFVCEWGYRD